MRQRILRVLAVPLIVFAFALAGLAAHPMQHAAAATNCHAWASYLYRQYYGVYTSAGGGSCDDSSENDYHRYGNVTIYYWSNYYGGWAVAGSPNGTNGCAFGPFYGPSSSCAPWANWGYCTAGLVETRFWDEYGYAHYKEWYSSGNICP